MRKNFIVAIAILLLSGVCANAQSWKDLLNKETIKSVVESVVEELDVLPENIEGTWNYKGIAVKLSTGNDNVLSTAASSAATSQVEQKLNGYLEKIGLTAETFSYTFSADSTFTTKFKKMTIPGTYTFSAKEDSIELDYGRTGRLKGVTMKAEASITLNTMNLLFNADKLLTFIEKLGSVAGNNATLASLTALASQYEGMKIGFELTRDTSAK